MATIVLELNDKQLARLLLQMREFSADFRKTNREMQARQKASARHRRQIESELRKMKEFIGKIDCQPAATMPSLNQHGIHCWE